MHKICKTIMRKHKKTQVKQRLSEYVLQENIVTIQYNTYNVFLPFTFNSVTCGLIVVCEIN